MALAVTLVFFITFFNAMQGVREVNPAFLPMPESSVPSAGNCCGMSISRQPQAGSCRRLRTSVGFAVVGAMIGEYLGASAGLGYLIAQAEGNFNSIGVFAGIMILAAFVLVIDMVLDVVEHRLIAWRPKQNQA